MAVTKYERQAQTIKLCRLIALRLFDAKAPIPQKALADLPRFRERGQHVLQRLLESQVIVLLPTPDGTQYLYDVPTSMHEVLERIAGSDVDASMFLWPEQDPHGQKQEEPAPTENEETRDAADPLAMIASLLEAFSSRLEVQEEKLEHIVRAIGELTGVVAELKYTEKKSERDAAGELVLEALLETTSSVKAVEQQVKSQNELIGQLAKSASSSSRDDAELRKITSELKGYNEYTEKALSALGSSSAQWLKNLGTLEDNLRNSQMFILEAISKVSRGQVYDFRMRLVEEEAPKPTTLPKLSEIEAKKKLVKDAAYEKDMTELLTDLGKHQGPAFGRRSRALRRELIKSGKASIIGMGKTVKGKEESQKEDE
jgi:hypothetical protein